MKKLLSALILSSFLAMGAVAALSVVPHAHGNDYDHSQHENCPIHQFGLHQAHADILAAAVLGALFLLCGFIEPKKSSSFFFSIPFGSLRAPPAFL